MKILIGKSEEKHASLLALIAFTCIDNRKLKKECDAFLAGIKKLERESNNG